jgi:hypothetical protein
MSVIVKGTKISGLGLGVTTVAKQYEHLVREFPDIRDVHRWGTLNLQLEYPLRILNPDYTTSAIEWEPGFKEKFSLTRIDIEPCATGKLQPAWIYVAHRSPHRANTLFIEMLTASLRSRTATAFWFTFPTTDIRPASCCERGLERFPAKWGPVRVKKTRQKKNLGNGNGRDEARP